MIYRTKYQRGAAVCTLLRDLRLRSTNPACREICDLCHTMLAAPAEARTAIEGRVAELVAAAEARSARLEGR